MIFDPSAKLLWHGDRVSQWLMTGRSKPILFEISPVGYCNASCPWCFFKDKHKSEIIETESMLSAIGEMPSIGVRAINWSGGGEPTLHEDFGAFVEFADMSGIQQGLFTNAYEPIPFEEIFEWIRISLTDKGFDAITRPSVPFGICLNHTPDQTEKELRRICQEARMFGAQYFQIRPALVGTWPEQPHIPTPHFLKEYEGPGFSVYVTDYKYRESVLPKKYDKCYGYHFVPSLDWDGNVSVCMYLTNEKEFNLGNILEKSVSEIMRDFPEHVLVSSDCQNCCKNHEINKVLFASKNMSEVNFL